MSVPTLLTSPKHCFKDMALFTRDSSERSFFAGGLGVIKSFQDCEDKPSGNDSRDRSLSWGDGV